MPKKKVEPKEVAQVSDEQPIEKLNELINEPASEPTPAPEEVPAVSEKPKAKKLEFVVTNSGGGEVRTYTVDIHGNKAEELANEYANKIGGSVV